MLLWFLWRRRLLFLLNRGFIASLLFLSWRKIVIIIIVVIIIRRKLRQDQTTTREAAKDDFRCLFCNSCGRNSHAFVVHFQPIRRATDGHRLEGPLVVEIVGENPNRPNASSAANV